VVRHECGQESEPYQVQFSANGHRYSCPLYAFQPRTALCSAETIVVAESPSAVAV
jgi:hypothetical protein